MTKETEKLQRLVESEFAQQTKNAEKIFKQFISKLDNGTIRTVENIDGVWAVNSWVKKGILLGFRIGKLKAISGSKPFSFFDKNNCKRNKG